MMDEIADPKVRAHKKRYDALLASDERAHFMHQWEEIAEVMSPRKTMFLGAPTPGGKRQSKVFDPTGIHALDLLAAGLHGMATNPSSKWFSLRLIDNEFQNDQEVLAYLSDVEDRIWSELYSPGTQFTTSLHECYHDLGGFGTSCIFIGERDDGKILFQARPLSEIVVAENADGLIDTVYRCSEYTVSQLMELGQREGWEEPSEHVRELYQQEKYDEKIKVVHVVGPRRLREYGRKDARNKPIESTYFEHKTGHVLRESGFDEMPYLVPRWSKLPGECYGRSPAMTALPDVKMLQQMSITLMKAAQKAADPTTFLPSDGTFGKQIRIVPGGINFYKGRGTDIVTLPVGSLPITLEIMEGVRNRIRTTMHVDVMQMFTPDANMTATEVMQRQQERMRMMGPIVGRLEAEMLGPLITRVFGVLSRADRLPKPPEALAKKEWSVEYVSPIATAQKAVEAEGLMKAAQIFGVFGEQGLMELAKRINFDRATDYAWELFNIEPDLLTNEEERAERAQQEEAMMATAQAPQVAGAAAQGARAVKDLGDAQATGGIDLNQLMGMAQAAPGAAAQAQAAPAEFDGSDPDVDAIMADMEA